MSLHRLSTCRQAFRCRPLFQTRCGRPPAPTTRLSVSTVNLLRRTCRASITSVWKVSCSEETERILAFTAWQEHPRDMVPAWEERATQQRVSEFVDSSVRAVKPADPKSS